MKHLLLTLGFAAALAATARADGIPEPGIIYYGAITNTANANALVTNSANQLIWTVQEAGGSALAIIAPVQNISNRWSFRFRVPFESEVGGNVKAASAFALRSASTTYNNTSVQIASGTNLYAANIQGIPNLSATHSAGTRGQVREVNLTVTALAVQSFTGGGGGGGGRTNTLVTAAVLLNPTFQFTYVGPNPEGGYQLEWLGAPTNRSYYLLRSTSVATPLEEQEVVRQFPPATTPVTVYADTNVVNTTTYFYRLIAP
jgi:hypothetical protein